MWTLVVLSLCAVGSIASPGLMRNLSPPKETSSTTLRLTAQRNDTGSWTTKFGDYHMTIEHKHFNGDDENDRQDGTWTLKVKHTTTTFEDEQGDENILPLNHNSSISDNKPEEDGVVMIYEEKPKDESYVDLKDVMKVYQEEEEEEKEEDNGRQVLQPMALRFEGSPPEDEDNAEETTTDKVETSEPDMKTVLDILENYRNRRRKNDVETYAFPEELPISELEPTTSTSTTEVPLISNEKPPALNFGEMTSEEMEHYHMKEERKQIMETFPRSRTLDLVSMGYTLYPDVGWLKLNTAHWQWDVARKSCQTEGAHLAIPDTLPKIRAFTRILKENADVIGRAVLKNQVFVGVYDPNNNRRFTTVKGEPFIAESVSIWFPNEPNDADPGEDCVTLHLEGKLRDVPCFFNLPFICQIDLADAIAS